MNTFTQDLGGDTCRLSSVLSSQEQTLLKFRTVPQKSVYECNWTKCLTSLIFHSLSYRVDWGCKPSVLTSYFTNWVSARLLVSVSIPLDSRGPSLSLSRRGLLSTLHQKCKIHTLEDWSHRPQISPHKNQVQWLCRCCYSCYWSKREVESGHKREITEIRVQRVTSSTEIAEVEVVVEFKFTFPFLLEKKKFVKVWF